MSYRKGYKAELELVHLLSKRGFLAIRSPRSGRIGLPAPDVIAIRRGKILAFECKFIGRAFKVPSSELEQLKQWERIGGAECYIAWKYPRRGWRFISLKHVLKRKGNLRKVDWSGGRTLDELTA